MIRKCLGIIVAAAAAGLSGEDAAAQGFVVGHTDVGPTVGLGGIGEASLAFGVRLERGIHDVPELGDGVIGIQAGVDYYSYTVALAGDHKWTYIPIGATANYHFNTENDRIDPFFGLGLGYSILSCDYAGSGMNRCGNSAVYLIGRAGIRYFIERIALYADVGAGAATIHAGVMFRVP